MGKSKLSEQCAINTAFQKMKQTDLNSVNHARMVMAVTMFFHENSISDRAFESPSFKLLLKYARLFGQEYKDLTSKGIEGPLLDINYNNVVGDNKENLCRESDVFGLCWLSDGATIARMPLLNVLGLCADTPPTCVAIEDCSGHMTTGGKKDATFIADLMEDIVKYDPDKTLTTIFWFNGASNVQKACKILEQKFPRAYSLHGGEHVVSLFFSDISKYPVIKVRSSCCMYIDTILTFCFDLFVGSCVEGMAPIQRFWFRCHSWLFGTGCSSQQGKEHWSLVRSRDKICYLVLCNDEDFATNGCTPSDSPPSNVQRLSKD
jgi:hypothetical protein